MVLNQKAMLFLLNKKSTKWNLSEEEILQILMSEKMAFDKSPWKWTHKPISLTDSKLNISTEQPTIKKSQRMPNGHRNMRRTTIPMSHFMNMILHLSYKAHFSQ